jgi:putative FmdB family regulatory protein
MAVESGLSRLLEEHRMPIYEYRCKGCDHRFELIVQGKARPACPSCGARSLEKQLSVFAVSAGSSESDMSGTGACGSCGDPRGPGSCSFDD